jgi:FAD/FMN-containing dehydrogenase
MAEVAVDPSARTARVEVGAPWSAVVAAATPHGLTGLHGNSGGVGVAGYTLGGGIGWLARSEGLSCNRVVAFEVVTADGTVLRADTGTEPELFWALRGGGGAHAVVTALEIELVELAEAYGGTLAWAIEDAPVVVDAYRRWIESASDATMSVIQLMRYPPQSTLPPAIRGKSVVQVVLVHRGTRDEGERLVTPLRSAATTSLDTLDTVMAAALGDLAGDPTTPLRSLADAWLLGDLTAEVADRFIEVGGPGVQIPLGHLEIRYLGGALDVAPPGAGALARLGGRALLYATGAVTTAGASDAIGAALDHIGDRVRDLIVGGAPLTFAERQTGTRPSFPSDVADRLLAAKRAYDPDGVILASHVVD